MTRACRLQNTDLHTCMQIAKKKTGFDTCKRIAKKTGSRTCVQTSKNKFTHMHADCKNTGLNITCMQIAKKQVLTHTCRIQNTGLKGPSV